jgi:Flp pilus assembly protein CpaB
MREMRSWIFLGLGLLLAGLTGLSLYGVAVDYGSRTAAAASDSADILVARVDIATHAVITGDMLAHKAFPKNLVPPGAIVTDADAIGQTTTSAIPAGATLVRSQLVSAGGRTGASLTVNKGQVLVAFPTTDPLTMGGLVKPGDHVDILATFTSGTGESARKTQTTVQNLEVLDVLVSGAASAKVASLTFAVDHQVALVLKYLRDTQASVDVVVRSRAENELAGTTSVDLTYVISTYGVKK